MLKVTLSHYRAEDGRDMHTVLVGGAAYLRETEDAAKAEAVAHRVFHDHYGHAELREWNGVALSEREIASK